MPRPRRQKCKKVVKLLKVVKCHAISCSAAMEVLELVVEKSIGKDVLARHSKLKSALRKVDQRGSTRTDARSTEEEKQRITAIIELCFEYRRENDPEERQNILRTVR